MEEDKSKETQNAAGVDSATGYVYGAQPDTNALKSQNEKSALPLAEPEANKAFLVGPGAPDTEQASDASSASEMVPDTSSKRAPNPVSDSNLSDAPGLVSDSNPSAAPEAVSDSNPSAAPESVSGSSPNSDPGSISNLSNSPSPLSALSAGTEMRKAGSGDPSPVTTVVSDEKVPLEEIFSFSWRGMLKYFWPLSGVLGIAFVIVMVPTITTSVLHAMYDSPAAHLISFFVSLVGAVINCMVALGMINLWLKIIDGEKIAVRDVYSRLGRVWNFALASFMYMGMVGLGYVCLIVPGIYLQIRFQFYPHFIVESNASPVASLKASFAITKGSEIELLFLGLINFFIGWIGIMALLVGAFPAQIVQNLAIAKAYRKLRVRTPVSEMPPTIEPLAIIASSEAVV